MLLLLPSFSVCLTYVGMNREQGGLGQAELVCLTYVGMNRNDTRIAIFKTRMPHVCGDEPYNKSEIMSKAWYAPRMWG